jgi:hypothetical protein
MGEVRLFSDKRREGEIVERGFARWIESRDFCVVPSAKWPRMPGEGPKLYFPRTPPLSAPDVLAFTPQRVPYWYEVKHDPHFSWWNRDRKWQTGCDIKYFNEYLQVSELTGIPLWIIFHCNIPRPRPDDRARWGNSCPDEAPVGIYGDLVTDLKESIDHPTDDYGSGGMYLWNKDDLICFDKTLDLYQLGVAV